MNKKNRSVLVLGLIVIILAAGGILSSTMFFGRPSNDQITPPSVSTSLIPSKKATSRNYVTPTAAFCGCTWAISGPTSVEFLVTSPSGQKTGYTQTTDTIIYEITYASYGIESGIADATGQGSPSPDFLYFGANNVENGTYELQVIGKQSGNYHLDITIAWDMENIKVNPVDGALEPAQVDKYTISFPDGTVLRGTN
jgi:hypothetical protein